tara:strand:- start:1186 stop:1629 length:444 start_codon:yes stop_codon:yes gene_type:complete
VKIHPYGNNNKNMLKIKSDIVKVDCSKDKCMKFISDMNNYHLLFPEDKISEWNADENSCFMKIQNTYSLDMMMEEKNEIGNIKIKSGSKSPFNFDLFIEIIENDENCTAQITCNANVSSALKIIIGGPLNQLFNYMAHKISLATKHN